MFFRLYKVVSLIRCIDASVLQKLASCCISSIAQHKHHDEASIDYNTQSCSKTGRAQAHCHGLFVVLARFEVFAYRAATLLKELLLFCVIRLPYLHWKTNALWKAVIRWIEYFILFTKHLTGHMPFYSYNDIYVQPLSCST